MFNAVLLLAEQFIIERALSSASPVTNKSKASLGLYILAGFLLCLGVGFMMFGLYALLAQSFTIEVAAVLTGGICITLALLMVLGALLVFQFKRKKAAHLQQDAIEMFHQFFENVDEELKEVVAEHPKLALALASVAGIFTAKRFF